MPEPDGPNDTSDPAGAGNTDGAAAPPPTDRAGRDGATRDGGGGPVDPSRIAFQDAGDGGWSGPPVAYVRDRLLYAGVLTDPSDALTEVRAAVASAGLDIVVGVRPDPYAGLEGLDGELARLRDELWVTTLEITPRVAGGQVDALVVLAAIRAGGVAEAARFSLDHVLFPGTGAWPGITGGWPGITGGWPGITGAWPGITGGWPGIGSPAEYGVPGRGGRMPVVLTAAKPVPCSSGGRRPVVAVPDTGLGAHPWFDGDPSVIRNVSFHGVAIGGTDQDGGDGVVAPMTGGLGARAGHGTFISGILRTGCPDAAILVIPLMDANGFADQGDVQRTLTTLLLRHVDGILAGRTDQVIDVLTVSMGYYPAVGDDPADAKRLRDLFEAFASWGVAVAAGAGNDATTRRFLPAAFAGDPDPNGSAILLSVGALNPEGSTRTMFTNAGPWVLTHRCGANVVSTMPTTFMGGGQASQLGTDPDGSVRSTIDPDDYRGGFGVWSGTSFSTPVLAAEMASGLAELELDDLSREAFQERARKVLDTALARGGS